MHEPYMFEELFAVMAQLGPVMMFWFMVLPALVAVLLLAILYRLLRTREGATPAHDDEARMIQEMYRAMGRMEERVEALETLLLDPDGTAGRARHEAGRDAAREQGRE